MRGFDVRTALVAAVSLIVALPGTGRAAREHVPLPGKVYAWSFQADTLGLKPAHSNHPPAATNMETSVKKANGSSQPSSLGTKTQRPSGLPPRRGEAGTS